MSITVADCLKLPSLRNCRVAAGHRGLDHIVHNVSVLEIYDETLFNLEAPITDSDITLTSFAYIKDNYELPVSYTHLSENGPPIFMFHGYQGDFINDKIWKVSRWLVRYLWKPLEIRGVNDPTSAAKNYTKVRKIEEEFIQYSCRKKCILIAGHTHKPTLLKTDCGMYFNSGSCVHPEAVTSIEIQGEKASLIKWSICSGADMGLYVCREVLKEMEI